MTQNETARIHAWVRGRVQGVGFRAFVASAAAQLNLNGWVRNVAWDMVETVAEGPRTALDEFIGQVKTGPRASRVEDFRVEDEPFLGEFTRFEIRASR